MLRGFRSTLITCGVSTLDYRNAAEVLPGHLLRQIQQYVEGMQLYIPRRGNKRGWGTVNGTQRHLAERNAEIRRRYRAGTSLEDLASIFYLSEATLRRIVNSQSENSSTQKEGYLPKASSDSLVSEGRWSD